MKIDTLNSDLITIGNINDRTQFSIVQNQKMFQFLSDKLYSDKIWAVVRELICNAIDSHTQAGNQKTKFKIHVPSSTNLNFSVEDFGIGLTDNDIKEIYTKYGLSTKDNENTQIGCLGLGAKSPFAYTSQFTIYARKDGVENVYLAYINEIGCPQLNRMAEHHNNAPNGLKIEIKVKHADYPVFIEKILYFFSYHNSVFPEFLNVSSRFTDRLSAECVYAKKYEFQSPDGFFKEYPSNFSELLPVKAIMGGICYKTDMVKTLPIPSKHLFTEKFLRCDIHLLFDIGDLDITISREQLEMTDKTIKNISLKIASLYDSYMDRLFEKLNKAITIIEKIKIADIISIFMKDPECDKLHQKLNYVQTIKKEELDTHPDLRGTQHNYLCAGWHYKHVWNMGESIKIPKDSKDLDGNYNYVLTLAFLRGNTPIYYSQQKQPKKAIIEEAKIQKFNSVYHIHNEVLKNYIESLGVKISILPEYKKEKTVTTEKAKILRESAVFEVKLMTVRSCHCFDKTVDFKQLITTKPCLNFLPDFNSGYSVKIEKKAFTESNKYYLIQHHYGQFNTSIPTTYVCYLQKIGAKLIAVNKKQYQYIMAKNAGIDIEPIIRNNTKNIDSDMYKQAMVNAIFTKIKNWYVNYPIIQEKLREIIKKLYFFNPALEYSQEYDIFMTSMYSSAYDYAIYHDSTSRFSKIGNELIKKYPILGLLDRDSDKNDYTPDLTEDITNYIKNKK